MFFSPNLGQPDLFYALLASLSSKPLYSIHRSLVLNLYHAGPMNIVIWGIFVCWRKKYNTDKELKRPRNLKASELVATANSDFAQICSMSRLFQSWFFLIFYFLLLLQLHLLLWVWTPTPALVNHMNSTRSSHIQDALRDRWSTRKMSGKDLRGNFLALSELWKDNVGDWGPPPNDKLCLETKHGFVAINLFSCSL
jgi:hypothetical protein